MSEKETNVSGPLIVSMGSSFAAGPGLPPFSNEAAGRSQLNYPTLFSQLVAGSRFVDLTVSGATVANLVDEPQGAQDGSVFAPQLDLLPRDADVITLTVGGNDMGYIGERMLDLIDRIHRKAPRARILLVDYIQVVGPHTRPRTDVPFNQDRIDRYRSIASDLVEIYNHIASHRNQLVTRVELYDLSEQHSLGCDVEWVGRFRLWDFWKTPAFHPSYLGMRAIAREVHRVYLETKLEGRG
ncbi:uncharacterized protein PFL1_06794 [Pseudozyma flocculosa PF-1]|uniref:SGNH hydrolase-type esterase domain-containing protein n=2 Tax=Pseudozyma flocculosa TaxID=84751 RepID=A0A5C3FED9_9BASI|nr:uncharacterized protein PFL1_06794 [Pseudozyma flocculosa PF-1]EPQ25657.1 hypothetical protein PFL1_06794 [Pseudozyma flocculosa PF-1]SPO42065.1 uncharacterized protein PSFLO_07548 [Pseudozyma flocculosa]